MKSLTNLILLAITILFSGCATVEDGSMLNDYRGDLMSLNEVSGMRFYDVYFDYLFINPSNAPKAKAHFQKHGFPDYIRGEQGNRDYARISVVPNGDCRVTRRVCVCVCVH